MDVVAADLTRDASVGEGAVGGDGDVERNLDALVANGTGRLVSTCTPCRTDRARVFRSRRVVVLVGRRIQQGAMHVVGAAHRAPVGKAGVADRSSQTPAAVPRLQRTPALPELPVGRRRTASAPVERTLRIVYAYPSATWCVGTAGRRGLTDVGWIAHVRVGRRRGRRAVAQRHRADDVAGGVRRERDFHGIGTRTRTCSSRCIPSRTAIGPEIAGLRDISAVTSPPGRRSRCRRMPGGPPCQSRPRRWVLSQPDPRADRAGDRKERGDDAMVAVFMLPSWRGTRKPFTERAPRGLPRANRPRGNDVR